MVKDMCHAYYLHGNMHICIMYKALDGTLKDVEKIQYSDFITLYNIQDRKSVKFFLFV